MVFSLYSLSEIQPQSTLDREISDFKDRLYTSVDTHQAAANIENKVPQLTPVWQTYSWGELLLESWAARQVFVAVSRDELWAIDLLSHIDIRSIGLGLLAGYCIWGPLIREDCRWDSARIQKYLEALKESKELSKCIFIQFEPLILASDLEGSSLVPLPLSARFLLEPTTRIIDLSESDEDILMGMKQKGRYNIRIAEKSGVAVSQVPPTKENIDIFYALLSDTLGRNKFSGNSRTYYSALVWYRCGSGEGLYFATLAGNVIAAAILVIERNTAVYYYGASTSDNTQRAHMPAYLLQWEMMRAARSAGARWYDFLWIAAVGDESSHLASVSEFKAKFGGIVYRSPQKFRLILRPFALRAYDLTRSIRACTR